MLFTAGTPKPSYQSWDLTGLTRLWHDGSAPNYGVILLADNEDVVGYDLRFRSSDDGNVDQPYLEIIYTQPTKTVYFLKDHLGSVRATVDDIGQVVGYDDYDPWGYILAGRSMATGASTVQGAAKNKFTGKEWDDEFGLNWYHFGPRPYDGEIGRFLSPDPLADNFPSQSPYHYAYNNPLAFNDPTGESAEAVVEKDSSGNETGNVIVSANLIFYGSAATSDLAVAITAEIQKLWNAAGGTTKINGTTYNVKFDLLANVVTEDVAKLLADNNTSVRNNFIRLSNTSSSGTSEMAIGGNVGHFGTADNLGTSTTAAHEFGHGLGLVHSGRPVLLGGLRATSLIGTGQPDIMAGRGTLVDPQYQYNPKARAGAPGGTIRPEYRKVLQRNITDVFRSVHFRNGRASIGRMTNRIF